MKLAEGEVAWRARKGILIDTNLLILFLVGSYDVGFIERCRRTSKYIADDYFLVKSIIAKAQKIIVSPHILSEVSNLTFTEFSEPGLTKYIAQVVEYIEAAKEDYRHKNFLKESNLLKVLGFTDVSIIEAAKHKEYLVFTDDLRLHQLLLANHCASLNLNHLRAGAWV